MEFHILGPLEVLDEGRTVPLGGSKQRALLAVLLLHSGQVLSTDRLIDELWGESPPKGAAKTVQVRLSRLRKALGGEHVIATRDAGYELALHPAHRLDSHAFERLVADGRAELAAGRPELARPLLDQALGLWRGTPLADLAYEPFAQAEVAHLEDLRVVALEQLVEAKLALGLHGEVVGQLETLVGEHPYREGLRAQLMLALYRSERQADALQAYQDARRTLVEELGIEPGERLRELERAILAQEPALAAPLPDATEVATPTGLPTGVVTFVLTDIEDSSGLWESDSDAMAAALELHDEVIGRTVQARDGLLLKAKGEGDATLAVFRRASDAVAAAVELQKELLATPWPGELELRVRIAVHTGEAHEREGDYFGPTLNRAARLRGLAGGGAIVMSHATTQIVQDRLPAEVELVHLGSRELRGLARPEDVFELRPSGARAAGPRPAQELRKTVTVLFAQLVESAADGRSLDPEARRRIMSRGADEARTVLERHGATVESYPGDALMAVFGVPLLHEDDALRAVRAAAEMGEALAELGNELEGAFGVRLATRVGIGTGEVIASRMPGGQPLASGEAVDAAKRLQELAEPGEKLIDERTQRAAESMERPSRPDSPLVGRDRQLQGLSAQFDAAVSDRACHLVTVLGVAGVGKSRLVQEFFDGLGEQARVLRGRCLPYGEGITYWPLAEVVRDATGGEPSPDAIQAQLAGDPKAGEIAAGIADALGLGDSAGGSSEKIFWAARRLLEVLAAERPLVVVLDDLQWAEQTFLDLVEHVADLSRDAPLVLLCIARPELLDERPGWGGGKLNATSILLEPLGEHDSAQLIHNLLGEVALPAEVGERIAEVTEGNPLFAEELLALMIEDELLHRGDDGWTAPDDLSELPVPATINALLAARLERLPDDELELVSRASVEGTVFHRGAVDELAPNGLAPVVEQSLTSLVRRDVIRPDQSNFAGDEAFRFRHMLIRDAAYRSLPKETRAELHEQFAAWLERAAESRVQEFEEIVGYHLEQAHLLLADLGETDAALGERAAERLESAGRRALGRSDLTGAIALLERAAALVPRDHVRRAALLPVLGAALIEAGRLAEAGDVLAEAAGEAQSADDERATARVRVHEQFLRLQRGESEGTAEAAAVVEQVVPIFRRLGDDHGLCSALRLRAWLHWIEAHADGALVAWEQAAEHARLAGAEHERIEVLGWVPPVLFVGPTPVPDAIRRCETIQQEVAGNLEAVAHALQPLAGLHAMEGRFDRARQLLADSTAAFDELGLTLNSAVSHHAAMVELLAGDPAAAERSLRSGYGTLEDMGDRALLSTTAAFLAQALLAQGRYDEAEHFAAVSEDLAADDDLITNVFWRGVRARVLAGRGELDEAELVAREAVLLAEKTDFLSHRADALADLAAVLKGRRTADAQTALSAALRLYEQKGNTVAADRTQAELATLAHV